MKMVLVHRKVDVRFDNTVSKPILLNPAHIASVSVEGGCTYVFMASGENFAVAESFEDMQGILS